MDKFPGDTPITWSLESGTLPTGLTLSATGAITGTPSTAGTSTFTVKATNTTGSGTKQLSITIATSSNPPNPPSLNGTTWKTSFTTEGMTINLTLNFTSTSAYTMTATSSIFPGSMTETGTYSVSGNNLTLTVVTSDEMMDSKPGDTRKGTIAADGKTFVTDDEDHMIFTKQL